MAVAEKNNYIFDKNNKDKQYYYYMTGVYNKDKSDETAQKIEKYADFTQEYQTSSNNYSYLQYQAALANGEVTQDEIIENNNTSTQSLSEFDMYNYAIFAIRNLTESAAQKGQSYVDLKWNQLIQNYTTDKLVIFLGIKSDKNGYLKWPDNINQVRCVWNQVLNEINSNSQNMYGVAYGYKTNEQIPYAVRLTWDDTSDENWDHPENTTNTNLKTFIDENPYFIIPKVTEVLSVDKDNDTSSTSTVVGYIQAIQILFEDMNNKIMSSISANETHAKILWTDFNAATLKRLYYLLLPEHKHKYKHSYTESNTKHGVKAGLSDVKFKEAWFKNAGYKGLTDNDGLHVYANEISNTSNDVLFQINTEYKFLSRLFNYTGSPFYNAYDWYWLLNGETNYIDGFVIGFNTQTIENGQTVGNSAYKNAQDVGKDYYINSFSNNINMTIDVDATASTVLKTTYDLKNTQRFSTLLSLIETGVSTDGVATILWSQIDSSAKQTTMDNMFNGRNSNKAFKLCGNILLQKEVITQDANNEDIIEEQSTVKVKANDETTYSSYISLLQKVYKTSNNINKWSSDPVGHTIYKDASEYKEQNSSDSSDSTYYVKSPVIHTVSTMSDTSIFYWDYLYYKDAFGKKVKKNGETKWEAIYTGYPIETTSYSLTKIKSERSCGIVVQYGLTNSDKMAEIIKTYADTADPKHS